MAEPIINEQINDKKCYNCGKIFRTPAELTRHKNRKTPCLIQDLHPGNVNNPNRCIYCNRVYSTKENLTKHLKICKIKNGGMEILGDKIRYEQEIRILKEKDADKDKKLDEMREEIQQMREHVEKLKALALQPQQLQQIINNTTNTVINNPVVNITINSYKNPDITGLVITQKEILSYDKFSRLLLEKLFFNKEIPQNHAIYLMNKKEKRLMIFDGKWNVYSGKDADDQLVYIRNVVHLKSWDASQKIEGIDGSIESWNALPGGVLTRIQDFNSGKDQLDNNSTYDVFFGGRFVADTIKQTDCSLLQ